MSIDIGVGVESLTSFNPITTASPAAPLATVSAVTALHAHGASAAAGGRRAEFDERINDDIMMGV